MHQPIDWQRAARNPVALVFLPWVHGVTIAMQDASGAIHGCRDVSFGDSFWPCIAAWIKTEQERGLVVDDRTGLDLARKAQQITASMEIRGD